MAALRELELDRAMLAEGVSPSSGEVRRPDGRVLRRFESSGFSGPSVVALRPALHGALLDAIGPDSIEVNREALDFEITNSGVLLRFVNGPEARGDVVIGADGVGSVIRKRLHPNEAPPRASAHLSLRGVAFDVHHQLGGLDAVAYFGKGVEAMTVKASSNAIYWYMSPLTDQIPASARDAAKVVAMFVPRFDNPFRAIVAATKPEDLRFDELFDREPISNWGSGPVTLLGDAAHPMLPHAGQGAAQALEDAVALSLVLRNGTNAADGLRRYEQIRSARTRGIVLLARRIARITTTRNPVICAIRNGAIRAIPSFMIANAARRSQRDSHTALRKSSRSS